MQFFKLSVSISDSFCQIMTLKPRKLWYMGIMRIKYTSTNQNAPLSAHLLYTSVGFKMEGNKDESERCIKIAENYARNGDKDKALKFLSKADKLYPSKKARGRHKTHFECINPGEFQPVFLCPE